MTSKRLHIRRGFTLTELLLGIAVIFILMGLIIAGVRYAQRYTKRTADTATLTSLKQGITQFQQQLGFVPPLVKDFGDPPAFNGNPTVTQSSGENRFNIYQVIVPADLQFLRTSPLPDDPDMRFSTFVLPYYLLGACDVLLVTGNRNLGPIDQVEGAGMLKPKRDGTFERTGQRFEPFFDLSRNTRGLVASDPQNGRVELRDSNGVPIRFYRWEHGKPTANANGSNGPVGSVVTSADLNVPRILGSPDENPALKSAKYALLSAGPNGLFGNEFQLPTGNPHRLTLGEMAAKLGIPTPAGTTIADPEVARLVDRAMEDNAMEVGQ